MYGDCVVQRVRKQISLSNTQGSQDGGGASHNADKHNAFLMNLRVFSCELGSEMSNERRVL